MSLRAAISSMAETEPVRSYAPASETQGRSGQDEMTALVKSVSGGSRQYGRRPRRRRVRARPGPPPRCRPPGRSISAARQVKRASRRRRIKLGRFFSKFRGLASLIIERKGYLRAWSGRCADRLRSERRRGILRSSRPKPNRRQTESSTCQIRLSGIFAIYCRRRAVLARGGRAGAGAGFPDELPQRDFDRRGFWRRSLRESARRTGDARLHGQDHDRRTGVSRTRGRALETRRRIHRFGARLARRRHEGRRVGDVPPGQLARARRGFDPRARDRLRQ